MSGAQQTPAPGGADPTAAGEATGGARLPRRDDLQIAGGASSSRPACDDCRLAAGKPGAAHPPPAPRPELFSIHITLDTARLLALLAAEHGDSLGGMVARLTVAEIERKGGIARV